MAPCQPIQVSSRVTPCNSNKADPILFNNSKDPTATIRARQWVATTTTHPCNSNRAMARRGRQALTCSSTHVWPDHLNNSKTGTINNLPTTRSGHLPQCFSLCFVTADGLRVKRFNLDLKQSFSGFLAPSSGGNVGVKLMKLMKFVTHKRSSLLNRAGIA